MAALTYNTLPRTSFITKDNQLVLNPPVPTGDSILIIGCALDGPINTPVSLNSLNNLEGYFGPLVYNNDYPAPDANVNKIGTYSGNSLVKVVKEVILGGGSNITMVRVGGTNGAKYATNSVSILGGLLSVQGYFPGSVYNGTTVAITAATGGVTVTVTPPSVKGSAFTMTFGATTTYDVIAANINNNPQNIAVQFLSTTAATTGTAAVSPYTLATVTLTGGTNGTLRDDYSGVSKSLIYQDITSSGGTFDQIRGTAADFLFVSDIYADDDVANSATKSFLTDIATYCYTESQNTYPIKGVIGVRPLIGRGRTIINNRVTDLTTVTTSYCDAVSLRLSMPQFIQTGIQYNDINQPGSPTVDIGAYVSVHAGPDILLPGGTMPAYLDSPASFYAGLAASLPPQRATTNYIIPNNVQMAYTYTQNNLNTLNQGISYNPNTGTGGGAYVTLFNRNFAPNNVSVVTTEDVTVANRLSNFRNLQPLRIIQAAEAVIEQISAQFLGQPNATATITALDTQIQSGLEKMVANGALNGGKGSGYMYQIYTGTALQQRLGQITIQLTLRPAYEIRSITTVVSVSQN